MSFVAMWRACRVTRDANSPKWETYTITVSCAPEAGFSTWLIAMPYGRVAMFLLQLFLKVSRARYMFQNTKTG